MTGSWVASCRISAGRRTSEIKDLWHCVMRKRARTLRRYRSFCYLDERALMLFVCVLRPGIRNLEWRVVADIKKGPTHGCDDVICRSTFKCVLYLFKPAPIEWDDMAFFLKCVSYLDSDRPKARPQECRTISEVSCTVSTWASRILVRHGWRNVPSGYRQRWRRVTRGSGQGIYTQCKGQNSDPADTL